MIFDILGLVFVALVALAILRFVPRPASRSWAVGLLVFAVVWNLSALVMAGAAHFVPRPMYLDAQKHQLQFNRGQDGELFGVVVNNPPDECRTFRNDRPWSMAAENSPWRRSPWHSCAEPASKKMRQPPGSLIDSVFDLHPIGGRRNATDPDRCAAGSCDAGRLGQCPGQPRPD